MMLDAEGLTPASPSICLPTSCMIRDIFTGVGKFLMCIIAYIFFSYLFIVCSKMVILLMNNILLVGYLGFKSIY